MSVPFVDVERLHAPLRADLMDAFARVISSGRYVMGPEVEAFEAEFAAALGVSHAVAVNSGTAALHLALVAAGIGPGDEVILPANTFIATAEAVSLAGASPVFVDVEPGTLNIDPDCVAEAITTNTRAIIPVHLYGRIANMPRLRALATRHRLLLVEDACQAHGAAQDGVYAGALGDVGCFSFYPTKNLGAIGEGGMLVTGDADIANAARSLRDHAQSERYRHWAPGFNYRLPELQAAGLRVCLPHLDGWNARRLDAARSYAEVLAGLPITLPAPAGQGEHVYHLYVVRSERRDALRAHLGARGVGVAIHYPYPIHLQEAYAACGLREGALPIVEASCREILSLPMHPYLEPREIAEVAAAIQAFTESRLEDVA